MKLPWGNLGANILNGGTRDRLWRLPNRPILLCRKRRLELRRPTVAVLEIAEPRNTFTTWSSVESQA